MNRNKRNLYQVLLTVIFAITVISCGGNEEVGTENMMSGPNSKTWMINEELDVAGDEQELSELEEQESIQFYADGRFAMGSGGMLQTGTWSFDQSGKRLTLQFEDEEMTENFEVVKLTDSKMELKAEDGSLMKLEVKE
ncbi:lipocalin family protein [Pontibacter locisalis]|uniref:Lipocalin family protein n=1 Tax=Pontibacter locisalis TaxID=1719035 RepID=A0ABW5IH25_9BACT